jgi:hypothetical protein
VVDVSVSDEADEMALIGENRAISGEAARQGVIEDARKQKLAVWLRDHESLYVLGEIGSVYERLRKRLEGCEEGDVQSALLCSAWSLSSNETTTLWSLVLAVPAKATYSNRSRLTHT